LLFRSRELVEFPQRFNVGVERTPGGDAILELFDLAEQLARLCRVVPEIGRFGELFLFPYRAFKGIGVKDAPIYRRFRLANPISALLTLRAWRSPCGIFGLIVSLFK
jgi:hypothetical protein